jgi:hypothetical protein
LTRVLGTLAIRARAARLFTHRLRYYLTWSFLKAILEKKIILETDASVVIENIVMGRSQKTQAQRNNSYALRLLLPLNFKYTAFLIRRLLEEVLY